MVDCFAEVLCDEVAGEVVAKGLADAVGRVEGLTEGLGMACVGDEDVFVGVAALVGCELLQLVAQLVDAVAGEGRDGAYGATGRVGKGCDGLVGVDDRL